jgi:hypothetical protein
MHIANVNGILKVTGTCRHAGPAIVEVLGCHQR